MSALSYEDNTSQLSYAVLDDFNGGLGQISQTIPSIFLMGSRRSGKTSIERVVFHKMEPHQTLYNIQRTSEIRMTLIQYNPLIQFQILDFPGGFDFADSEFKPGDLFQYCSVLLFVIDAQDRPYTEALNYIVKMVEIAHSVNQKIQYDLLIHKVDAESFFTNDAKFRAKRDIENKISELLSDLNLQVPLSSELTSIYDHTIFEQLSKVIQKLISKPVRDHLESVLTTLVNKCDIEKAYIFDVASKLYISTDANPVDFENYSLCSDMIDVVVDISSIYGGYQNQSIMGNQSGFDEESDAVIELQAGNNKEQILSFREVGHYLALICLMKKPANRGLLEYNMKCFRKQFQKLLLLNNEYKKNSVSHSSSKRSSPHKPVDMTSSGGSEAYLSSHGTATHASTNAPNVTATATTTSNQGFDPFMAPRQQQQQSQQQQQQQQGNYGSQQPQPQHHLDMQQQPQQQQQPSQHSQQYNDELERQKQQQMFYGQLKSQQGYYEAPQQAQEQQSSHSYNRFKKQMDGGSSSVPH